MAAPTVPKTKTDTGIPNYRVNDASRIDITTCEHEFEISMARNDFSAETTEASMGGGFGGFSVNVSTSVSTTKSSAYKKTDKNFKRTLVARYMYPRCDLFLYPDDLEPTPELAAAIQLIQKTKSIKHLRKLHAEFGHIFCQTLTLGGRLQSTKTFDSTSTMTEQEQKETFKVSVGIEVTTPYVSTSIKHTSEKGSSESQAQSEKNSKDTVVFEAVGGDTILANNAPAWSATVAKCDYWRVINRDGLAPLADMLSQMPGYQQVKTWFIQAIPAMQQYIALDESREVITRLRLVAPLNGLYLHSKKNPSYYLGHNSKTLASPRVVGLTPDNFWGMPVWNTKKEMLFSPETYRAPALIGYEDSNVGGSLYGAEYNEEFATAEWNIVAPFSEFLTHGCRIILRTKPYTPPPPPPPAADDNTSPSPAATGGAPSVTAAPPTATQHMVVFRNQQGVFLPAMSDNDEYQYWRLLKRSPSARNGEAIKEGDEVRLCWAFDDQTTGFRDYVDDAFGRRRMQCPAELAGKVLYLKLPWPRFESLFPASGDSGTRPNSLVMADVAGVDPAAVALTVKPAEGKGGQWMYVMQDTTFRIDVVTNGGRGDAGDYMLSGVDQERDGQFLQLIRGNVPWQWWFMVSMFYF
ncbi:hypothetical protein B0H67DRAFT_539495 [Lasiosphaeris hirsuta]|uniref:MACPF-like domain-containing protein n=1 Tax=Lasiosphaeris hirsuta TaxID=260670 RepID=A0AA40A7F8_9PEZI|nr:hypothetical protein B0H67DRAFT_539495 [Lasiosphaeris hirsuta]